MPPKKSPKESDEDFAELIDRIPRNLNPLMTRSFYRNDKQNTKVS